MKLGRSMPCRTGPFNKSPATAIKDTGLDLTATLRWQQGVDEPLNRAATARGPLEQCGYLP